MPSLVVIIDDLLQPLAFRSRTLVAGGGCQRVVAYSEDTRELHAKLLDVAVGVGDIAAIGTAIVLVGCHARVALSFADLAERSCLIEDAGHGISGENLQPWVGEQVARLLRIRNTRPAKVLCARLTR